MEEPAQSGNRCSIEIAHEQHLSGAIRDTSFSREKVDRRGYMAQSHGCETLGRQPTSGPDPSKFTDIQKEDIYRQPVRFSRDGQDRIEHSGDLRGRDDKRSSSGGEGSTEREGMATTARNPEREHQPYSTQISLCDSHVETRSTIISDRSETAGVSQLDATVDSELVRSGSRAEGGRSEPEKFDVVMSTFNCEGWDSTTILNLLIELSDDNRKNIVLCVQETWRYEIPADFCRQVARNYSVLHVSAMDPKVPRSRGRPFGGLCMILSKNIKFTQHYSNPRCQSVIICDQILVNNVYLPYNDSRKSVNQNTENYTEAISHLSASHELAVNVGYCITLGDINCAPSDISARADVLAEFLNTNSYEHSDLLFYDNQYSHKSGRLIDRIFSSYQSEQSPVQCVNIRMLHENSDHFPVISNMCFDIYSEQIRDSPTVKSLNWGKVSPKSVEAYSRLAEKLCKTSLCRFYDGEIDGPSLYNETVSNLRNAASACIPKYKNYENRNTHNIPLWRERMSLVKHNVDTLLSVQFLQGGPTRCDPSVRLRLRIARAQYKRQLRTLRREIRQNVADHVTRTNCHKVLYGKPKAPQPPVINGHTRDQQPEMWRSHFKSSYKAEETPYNGDLLDNINDTLTSNNFSFSEFTIDEVNDAILLIDTNKSYNMHFHWKYLPSFYHTAKYCLVEVFNCWANDSLTNKPRKLWTLFDTNLSPIPKNGKKNLSELKSWRPISLGTSENWILEKVFLKRLQPFLGTDDCQFGYKEGHSTSHAIELVRILERSSDCHVCMLDASSAFDRISWFRIRDQLLQRDVPLYLTKLCLLQLSSNRISVCGTAFIYPRIGVKQGGVLSGRYFSMCYDELVKMLRKTGSGVLFTSFVKNNIMIQIIVYADDVILISKSPYGLAELIDVTFQFARLYHDIDFNPSKSRILRLGTERRRPVSVRGIPVSNSYEYLGVMVGRGSCPERFASSKLYTKANIMLKENKQLMQCNDDVKNLAVKSYGNVYALENFVEVGSKLRQAHRYLTQSVHQDWRSYADLPGPNIRSRRLYTVYNLDSLEVLHRRRRNNFLLKSFESDNLIIRGIIGTLPRITV